MLVGLALLIKVWAPAAACAMLSQAADPVGSGVHCAMSEAGSYARNWVMTV